MFYEIFHLFNGKISSLLGGSYGEGWLMIKQVSQSRQRLRFIKEIIERTERDLQVFSLKLSFSLRVIRCSLLESHSWGRWVCSCWR